MELVAPWYYIFQIECIQHNKSHDIKVKEFPPKGGGGVLKGEDAMKKQGLCMYV